MNKIVVSLLKGSNTNKLSLLNEGHSYNDLITICESKELKIRYNLEKGYGFSRLSEILQLVDRGQISTLTINEELYPSNLKNIYDPPFLIYIRGDYSSLLGDLVSVVGTRKPSLRGNHESFKLGLDLGKVGVSVVSGLALGVDCASHLGNIKSGGKTIAVLGSGVDTIYPKANKALAGEILKTGGSIISEFPPGESPQRYNFPKRNRIIAGLTRHLVIVQAPKSSGSLITGDFALQMGGEVYVHSVGVGDKRFLGSDKYFKEGAKKIDSAFPILSKLNKDFEISQFNSESYTPEDLLSLELSGKIIKYKGCFFKL